MRIEISTCCALFAAAVLVLLSFGVGYGWANSSQGSLRMPKQLAFLEPALKKITHAREDAADPQDATETVAEAIEPSEQPETEEAADVVATNDDDAEEDPQTEEVAPQDAEKTELSVASSKQEKEEPVEGEPMERWTQMGDDNAAADEDDKIVADGKPR